VSAGSIAGPARTVTYSSVSLHRPIPPVIDRGITSTPGPTGSDGRWSSGLPMTILPLAGLRRNGERRDTAMCTTRTVGRRQPALSAQPRPAQHRHGIDQQPRLDPGRRRRVRARQFHPDEGEWAQRGPTREIRLAIGPARPECPDRRPINRACHRPRRSAGRDLSVAAGAAIAQRDVQDHDDDGDRRQERGDRQQDRVVGQVLDVRSGHSSRIPRRSRGSAAATLL
jgi:hypothetical protein